MYPRNAAAVLLVQVSPAAEKCSLLAGREGDALEVTLGNWLGLGDETGESDGLTDADES